MLAVQDAFAKPRLFKRIRLFLHLILGKLQLQIVDCFMYLQILVQFHRLHPASVLHVHLRVRHEGCFFIPEPFFGARREPVEHRCGNVLPHKLILPQFLATHAVHVVQTRVVGLVVLEALCAHRKGTLSTLDRLASALVERLHTNAAVRHVVAVKSMKYRYYEYVCVVFKWSS